MELTLDQLIITLLIGAALPFIFPSFFEMTTPKKKNPQRKARG